MKPLIYFSYGMTKTGSTLAYQLTRAVLVAAGCPQPKLKAAALRHSARINHAQHLTEADIADIRAEVANWDGPVVIKTHTRPDDPAVVALLQSGEAVAHACYRDPRDMALSMLDHGKQARAEGKPAFSEIETLDDALNGIRNQMDSLTAWLRLPNVLPLCFDDIAFRSAETVDRIADQLGLRVDAEQIAEQVKDTTFTQFNKGVASRYRSEMSAADADRITTEFSPFYQTLIDGPARHAKAGPVHLPPPALLRHEQKHAA